jgi:hypothetical protein
LKKKPSKFLHHKNGEAKIIIVKKKSHGWELGSQRALFTLHPI